MKKSPRWSSPAFAVMLAGIIVFSFWQTPGVIAASDTASPPVPNIASAGNGKAVEKYPLPVEGRRLLRKEPRHYDSVWRRSLAQPYQRMLVATSPDILVLPFEAQHYPVDKIGRSLMTRLLIERLRARSSRIVSDFDLVDRALGHNRARHTDDEVARLLTALKPTTYIRGYVGHGLRQKDGQTFEMTVTVVVYERPTEVSDQYHETGRRTWTGLVFDDEHYPHDVFSERIDELVRFVLPNSSQQSTERRSTHESVDDLPLPETPIAMIEDRTTGPAEKALALQLLGVLTPEVAARDRHRLFERSLILLEQVSPSHPHYALVRARALFNLARRPGALLALEDQKGAAALALRHYLNANLPELTEAEKAISAPLLQLMARIELNRLAQRFGYEGEYEPAWKDAFYARYPAWKTVVDAALNEPRAWELPDIPSVKKELDTYFPHRSFSLETVLLTQSSQRGSGDLEHAFVDAIVNHTREILESAEPPSVPATGPSRLDYVHLLDGISQYYAVDRLEMVFRLQGLPEKASEMAEGFLESYEGHPDLLVSQLRINKELLETTQGVRRKSIEAAILPLADRMLDFAYEHDSLFFKYRYEINALLNGLRQPMQKSGLTVRDVFGRLRTYRGLFPSRDFSSGELAETRLAMKYVHDQFEVLTQSYQMIRRQSQAGAEELVEENSHRFHGHRDRPEFLATVLADGGDERALRDYYTAAIEGGSTDWTPYWEVARRHVYDGDYDKALSVWQKYPPFREPSPRQPLALSNYAYLAGSALYWRGAHSEAIPLYELSASFGTGAESEFASAARVAMVRGDYVTAAQYHFARGRRYNSPYGFRDALSLLHLLGESDQAWLLFDALLGRYAKPTIWESAVVGHRIAGTTPAEIEKWLSTANRMVTKHRYISFPARFALMALTMDRPPHDEVPAMIHRIAGDYHARVTPYPSVPPSVRWQIINKRKASMTLESSYGFDTSQLKADEAVESELALFARGYNDMKRQRYERAYQAFVKLDFLYGWHANPPDHYVFPYLARAGMKSGHGGTVARGLAIGRERDAEEPRQPSSFDYRLAAAFAAAEAGDHDKALSFLEEAFGVRPHTEFRPVMTWYQIVEACLWLNEDFGDPRYLSLALEWSKRYQVIAPMYSWAYAVEARYSKNYDERRRALGIALHLDRHSWLLSGISDSEKEQANRWFQEAEPLKNAEPNQSAGQGA